MGRVAKPPKTIGMPLNLRCEKVVDLTRIGHGLLWVSNGLNTGNGMAQDGLADPAFVHRVEPKVIEISKMVIEPLS